MLHRRPIVAGARIASPYGLALLSSLVFTAACIFPPKAYSYLMREPDLIFIDIPSVVFYELCVVAFVGGIAVSSSLFSVKSAVDRRFRLLIAPTPFILIPLVSAFAVNILSIVSVARNGELLSLLASGEGEAVKEALHAQGGTLLSSTGLMGITWWAVWRYKQLEIKGVWAWVVRVFICLATASTVASAWLKLNRGELMSSVIGMAVILVVWKVVIRQASHKYMLKVFVISLLCSLALFVVFVVPRGVDNIDKLTVEITAGTLASYNRLAAVVSGRLRYPYGGTGVYLSGFLAFNNLFNRVCPLRELFNWPSFYDVWMSEFGAVWRAGLNGNSIWSGAFGDIFSDVGWFAPVVVFFNGVVSGCVWQSVRRGQTIGIVLYPWVAFCILFWCGTNMLLDTRLVLLLIISAALAGYESLLIRPTATCRRSVRAGQGNSIDGLVKCP